MAVPSPVARHTWISRRTWTAGLVSLSLVGGWFGYTNPPVVLSCDAAVFYPPCDPSDAERLLSWLRTGLGSALLVATLIGLAFVLTETIRRHPAESSCFVRHRSAVSSTSAIILGGAIWGFRNPTVHGPVFTNFIGVTDYIYPRTFSFSDRAVQGLDSALIAVLIAIPVALLLELLLAGIRRARPHAPALQRNSPRPP